MEKEKTLIWPLMRVDGDYEDRHSEVVKAYHNREDAEAERVRLRDYYDKLQSDYDGISFSVEDKKRAAFMEMLKDTNKELYEQSLEAFRDDEAFCSGDFDYDRFYDEEVKFTGTPDVIDYYRRTGCTDEEIRLIHVCDEVDGLFGSFPYFYVPHTPIELV